MSENKSPITMKIPELDIKRINSKSVESAFNLDSMDHKNDYIKIKAQASKINVNPFNLTLENKILPRDEKIKTSQKVSEATTATNASYHQDLQEKTCNFEKIQKSSHCNKKISHCKIFENKEKMEIEYKFEENFNDFIDSHKLEQNLILKKNQINSIQRKYYNLDSLDNDKKDNSLEEDINELDYSFVSNTNSEFLQISSCEDLSDYELRELDESGFLEEINKSYIDQVAGKGIVNHNEILELSKIILSYSKLKTLIQRNLLSLNVHKFAKLKMLNLNSLRMSGEKKN
jgi:hypothetical protein